MLWDGPSAQSRSGPASSDARLQVTPRHNAPKVELMTHHLRAAAEQAGDERSPPSLRAHIEELILKRMASLAMQWFRRENGCESRSAVPVL